MWARWRSVACLPLRYIKVSFVHKPLDSNPATPLLSSRFSDRRLCPQAFSWSHGRMFGNPRSWPRGRPAQVANIPPYIYIYTLLPVDFMSISTIFWSTLYVFWNVSYSKPHTYVLFLIFQSCSLRRRGCMQPCTILMETGAVTYRVSVFIPQHVLLSFIFSDFTAIWCSFVCACWQLERRSH